MILGKKSLILAKKGLFLVSLSFLFIQTTPQVVYAAPEVTFDYGRGPVQTIISTHPNTAKEINQDKQIQTIGQLPANQDLPYYETYITATAYTSRAAETDSSPYTAAWGDHVFWGMVASNAFPRGTKIQIPDYFGDKMFTILDTMNKRYYYKIDIWMPKLRDAKNWGAHYIKIKVYR